MHRKHIRLSLSTVLAAVLASSIVVRSQTPTLPAAASTEEAAAMAQYWVLLAQRRYADAAATVAEVLKKYPKNVSALALVIEATVARGGAGKALEAYETWLGRRTLEEPGVLRRIARAYLFEWAVQVNDTAARKEALQALMRDGEPTADLGKTGDAKQRSTTADATVDRLAAELNAATGIRVREIQRLADTGHPRAARTLVAVLRDQLPENRAVAADALGRLGTAEHIPALTALLKDPHGVVRVSAAGALYRLGDAAGVQLLQALATSDQATDRLTAARLLAPQPDENWKALVRGLTSDPDPSVRLQAARLITPHDPQLARSVLGALAGDANVTIRDEANSALAEAPDADLAALRKILRAGNGLAKVRAADRVLALTRQPG